MNRALLPSLFLALAALSCSNEPPVHPGIFSTGATVTLTDLGAIGIPPADVPQGDSPLVTTDTGSTTDAGTDTEAGACGVGFTVCSSADGGASVCTNTRVDDLNCGACGRACPKGEGCVSGRCI